jgi:predicted CXXCH cytochrome family protein
MGLCTKSSGRIHLLFAAALLLVGLFVTACGTHQRYKVLTFFFEGVPEPGSELVVAEAVSEASTTSKPKRKGFTPVVTKMFMHEPFELKECKNCHKTKHSQALLKEEPQLCYDCHGKMLKRMTFVHKPAEEGNCKACHVAHQSPHWFLLPKPELNLCNDCHDPVNTQEFVHTPVAEGQCSKCHNPHGGKNAMYLPAEGDLLCAECHEPDEMMALEVHKNVGEQSCTPCHTVHQSSVKGLLSVQLP